MKKHVEAKSAPTKYAPNGREGPVGDQAGTDALPIEFGTPEEFAAAFKRSLSRFEAIEPHIWTPGPGCRDTALASTAPIFLVANQRARSGKSFLLTNLAEYYQELGIRFAIADFDLDNTTLTHRFGENTVATPLANTTSYFDDALSELVRLQVRNRMHVILDIGHGGMRLFRDFARRTHLQAAQESAGIRPILLAPLGPSLDDLDAIKKLDGIYMPRDVVLALNEGLLPQGRDVLLEFKTVLNDAHVRGLLASGSKPMKVPRMPGGTAFLNTRMPFARAADGDWPNPLDILERGCVADFIEGLRRELDAQPFLVPRPTAADRG